jgi:hypothetical protein
MAALSEGMGEEHAIGGRFQRSGQSHKKAGKRQSAVGARVPAVATRLAAGDFP